MQVPDFFPGLHSANDAQVKYGRACRARAWHEYTMGGEQGRQKWARLTPNDLDSSDAGCWISVYHAVMDETPLLPAINGETPEQIGIASECRAKLWRRLVADEASPPHRQFTTRKSAKFWIHACKKLIRSNSGLV